MDKPYHSADGILKFKTERDIDQDAQQRYTKAIMALLRMVSENCPLMAVQWLSKFLLGSQDFQMPLLRA